MVRNDAGISIPVEKLAYNLNITEQYRSIMDKHRSGNISAPEDILLLAAATRQEVVDTLGSLGGEASAAELSGQLGRPMDGLYYHLELLRDAGLVTELEDQGNGERRFRLSSPGGQPLRLVYRLECPGVPAALAKFARSLLKVAGEDFEAGMRKNGVATAGAKRELWIARNKGWLSDDELEEVNTLLLRLGELTSQPRSPGRERLASFAFALSPVAPRGKRRSATRVSENGKSAPA
jgi:DNA-binding transcriptional ArsR family regulator